MKKHLISIDDLTSVEILNIFELTKRIKSFPKKFSKTLNQKTFGLIFEKPSTRTWISFETGILQLGGNAIYLGPQDIKLGIREEIRDVARVLARYLEGVILRTCSHETITKFGTYFDKPIINGLSDLEHPCQALTDYFTIYEKFGNVKQPILAFIGDGNNVLASLLLLAAKLGGQIHYATPKQYEPNAKIVAKARAIAKITGAVIRNTHDPEKAIQGSNIIYTDVWISMGEEKIRNKKMKTFQGMQINQPLLSKAKPDALIMHCLPAHRGEEITDDILESNQSIVFDQAENRLHVQKAILVELCKLY